MERLRCFRVHEPQVWWPYNNQLYRLLFNKNRTGERQQLEMESIRMQRMCAIKTRASIHAQNEFPKQSKRGPQHSLLQSLVIHRKILRPSSHLLHLVRTRLWSRWNVSRGFRIPSSVRQRSHCQRIQLEREDSALDVKNKFNVNW